MPRSPVAPEVIIGEAVQRAQQRLTEYIERFAAAYIKLTDIPPDEAVLCTQMMGDGVMRMWFCKKSELPDLPGKYGPIVEDERNGSGEQKPA